MTLWLILTLLLLGATVTWIIVVYAVAWSRSRAPKLEALAGAVVGCVVTASVAVALELGAVAAVWTIWRWLR